MFLKAKKYAYPSIDINECTIDESCGIDAECINSDGSYSCVCSNGLLGDPYIECKSGKSYVFKIIFLLEFII